VSTILTLTSVARSRGRLTFTVNVHDQNYDCVYEYQDICFDLLEQHFGHDQIDWLCFHIIAFEMAKFCSLAPEKIDFGPLSGFCTPVFFKFWQHIVHHIWSQWRYENKRPEYLGPQLNHSYSQRSDLAIKQRPLEHRYLVFCGGGKDSLVAMRAMDRQGIDYGSFVYTHSLYGEHQHQLALVQNLVEQTNSRSIHAKQIHDGFMNKPQLAASSKAGNQSVTHAETPCSIFGALPLMLSKGYRCAVLAHERSADIGNLVWQETGEEVNHQWGKSWEAEHCINQYICQHLINEFSYFSVLKPLTDVIIFNLLQQDLDLLKHIHSCNTEKPWCKKCAKCAYVWLNLKAYLPAKQVDEIFKDDLFDYPENELWFRQMLGLESHTPFECIGQIPETRLALELYLQTNDHPAARRLRNQFEENFTELVEQMTIPVFEDTNLDSGLRHGIEKYFNAQTGFIRQQLLRRLAC